MYSREKEIEKRKEKIERIKSITPYLEKLNLDLMDINSAIRIADEDEDNDELDYSYWIYEIKVNLDFIASALTDEFGNRFGACGDGHIFRLLKLYEESIQIPGKSIQEKIMLNILIKVCTEVIINNGDGLNDRTNYNYALSNTREFIEFLVSEQEIEHKNKLKSVWLSIDDINEL